MKKLLYMIVLIVGFQSCEKETFDYEKYQAQTADINSIYFSPGSTTLIADGKATLQFVLEAYRNVKINDGQGGVKDTSMLIDLEALSANDVKIFVDGKQIEGTEYSTLNTSQSSISCYAQIGEIKSEVKSVSVLKPKDVGAKRYVNVIFHVFELNPTDYLYDPLSYQEVTPERLNDAIDYANEVFNNKVGRDPNGGSANIEFRMAKENPSGAMLAIPGYNKITYDISWKAAGALHTTPYNVTNIINKINATAAYQWDKEKYLNIYVVPSSPNNSVGNFRAAYQIVPNGEIPIDGIEKVVSSEAEIPTNDFYTIYGLGLHRSSLFPDPSRKIEIASYLGIYYGLYSTNSSGTTVVDYVSDTRKYLSGGNQTNNISNGLLKTGIDGEKFLANNAMDDIRYASLRNSLTQGQVERIRQVMEWSPVRKAWSLQ